MDTPETIQQSSTLRESCVLVDYHGGFYNWLKRDAKASLEYSTSATNDSASYQNYKNIFVGCDGVLGAIKGVINEARTFHYVSTLAAPKSWGTAAFISNSLVPMYRQTMRQFELKLDTLKTHLKSEWSTMQQSAKTHLGSAYNEADYPSIETVLAACYIQLDFKPVPSGKDITHPTLDFIKKAVESETAVAYDKAIGEVWTRLLQSVEAAKKNLMKLEGGGGRFRTEWMQNLKDLLPVLRELNISHDRKFDEMADEAQKLLRFEESDLKSNAYTRQKLSEEAQRLFDKLSAISPKQEAK